MVNRFKRFACLLACMVTVLPAVLAPAMAAEALPAAAATATPKPTPTATPKATATPAPTLAPTATATPTATPVPTPASTPQPGDGIIETIPLEETPSFFSLDDTLAVYCIPVGAQDCYLIVCDGEAMVLDCAALGRDPTPDFLLKMLKGLGITELKYAVNTHPHSDHVNGFPALLEAVPTREYLTCFALDYDKIQRRILKEIGALDVPVRLYTEGEPLSLGSARISTYRYHRSTITNDLSLVVHLRYGERSILLTADIGLTAQRKLAAENGEAFKADILKLPHHGVGAVSNVLLDTVQPALAFLSNGVAKNNKLARDTLSKLSIPYYHTSRQCLVMITDGSIWQVQQWEKDSIRLPGLTVLPHQEEAAEDDASGEDAA